MSQQLYGNWHQAVGSRYSDDPLEHAKERLRELETKLLAVASWEAEAKQLRRMIAAVDPEGPRAIISETKDGGVSVEVAREPST